MIIALLWEITRLTRKRREAVIGKALFAKHPRNPRDSASRGVHEVFHAERVSCFPKITKARKLVFVAVVEETKRCSALPVLSSQRTYSLCTNMSRIWWIMSRIVTLRPIVIDCPTSNLLQPFLYWLYPFHNSLINPSVKLARARTALYHVIARKPCVVFEVACRAGLPQVETVTFKIKRDTSNKANIFYRKC